MTDKWTEADKAYLTHHAQCGECKSAGMRPGLAARCAIGKVLWDSYLATPLPPKLTRKWASPSIPFKKKK